MADDRGRGDAPLVGLPSVVPLFPLPNAVLFPGVPLPLHIFEPRYRELVRDVSRVEDRLIGMVLLRGDWRRDYHGSPDIYPVGCAGRMVSVEPLADGRYNILLQGVREFVISGEDRQRSYRQANVSWRPPGPTALPPGFRTRLCDLVRGYLGDREPKRAGALLDDASVSDELLVNFLCYALEFSPLEKQALLEAPSLSDRGARLCEVVQFAMDAGALADDGDEWYH